jgi:hypothetical protein
MSDDEDSLRDESPVESDNDEDDDEEEDLEGSGEEDEEEDEGSEEEEEDLDVAAPAIVPQPITAGIASPSVAFIPTQPSAFAPLGAAIQQGTPLQPAPSVQSSTPLQPASPTVVKQQPVVSTLNFSSQSSRTRLTLPHNIASIPQVRADYERSLVGKLKTMYPSLQDAQAANVARELVDRELKGVTYSKEQETFYNQVVPFLQ